MSQEIVKNRSTEFSELFKKTNIEDLRKEDVAAFRKMINSDPRFYASIIPLAGITADSIVD